MHKFTSQQPIPNGKRPRFKTLHVAVRATNDAVVATNGGDLSVLQNLPVGFYTEITYPIRLIIPVETKIVWALGNGIVGDEFENKIFPGGAA